MALKHFLLRIKYYFTYHNSNFEHVVLMNALFTMLDEQLFPVYIGGQTLGATSIVKIGEVRLSDEIGEGGFESLKKNEHYDYYH